MSLSPKSDSLCKVVSCPVNKETANRKRETSRDVDDIVSPLVSLKMTNNQSQQLQKGDDDENDHDG